MSDNDQQNEKTPGPETAELLYRFRIVPETVARLHEELAAMVESDDPADVERLRRFEAAEAAVKAAGERAILFYSQEWCRHVLEVFQSECEEAADLIENLTILAETAVEPPTKRAA